MSFRSGDSLLAPPGPACSAAHARRVTCRRLRRCLALFAAVVIVSGAAACSSGGSPEGLWGTAGEGQPRLELKDNGSLTGTDGCNQLNGTWSDTDGKVTFGKVASTQMHCEGVDTWLSGLASATVDGDTLHVLDASGTEIGTLTR